MRPKSESDFQQIKDWNVSAHLASAIVLTLSESDFQQIKDWNIGAGSPAPQALISLNPTSNKSRIETFPHHKNPLLFPRVWIRLPTNQGLKLVLIIWLIPWWSRVWIRLPTNQGLKPVSCPIRDRSQISVWIRLPTNQGLKPFSLSETEPTNNVWIRLPTNQGLKHHFSMIGRSFV